MFYCTTYIKYLKVYATDENKEVFPINKKNKTTTTDVNVHTAPAKIQIYKHLKLDGNKLMEPVTNYDVKQHLIHLHQIPVRFVDMVSPIKNLGTYDVKYDNGKKVQVEVLPETRW